jgi:hypothetical protein
MNEMPSDWSRALEEVYPKRSGPNGWKGMRLLLAVRRALIDSTWEQILSGCKAYKDYCCQAGIEGTSFVQAPLRFIQEASYLESFSHKAPEDPKVIEAKVKETERWERAHLLASRLDPILKPMQHESVASFETRIRLESTRNPSKPVGVLAGRLDREARPAIRGSDPQLSERIADLAQRLRIAK